jgi:hypothetical protein
MLPMHSGVFYYRSEPPQERIDMGGNVHSRIRRAADHVKAADFKKTSTRRSAPIRRIKGVVVLGNSGLLLAAVIVLVLSIKICGATYQQPNASDITSLPKAFRRIS